MDFSTLLTNLNQSGKPYERILGGKQNRDALASFHKNHPDINQAIATNLLYNFISNNVFTKEQYEAFQAAVIGFGKSLDGCLKEFEEENVKIETA